MPSVIDGSASATFQTPLPVAQGGTGAATALAAVTALLGAQSAADPGYMRIGDLLVQWGSTSSSSGADTTVTFPVAFSTACYAVATSVRGAYTSVYSLQLNGAPTTTQFVYAVTNAGSRVATPAYWIAIGK